MRGLGCTGPRSSRGLRPGDEHWGRRVASLLEGGRTGGCSAPNAVDPVSIPHHIEKRRVTTGTDPEPNPQVDGLFVPPLQVAESA